MNSKDTRVLPVFTWLANSEDSDWPVQLLGLAKGLNVAIRPGRFVEKTFEKKVLASTHRLAWMIENACELAPSDGNEWRAFQERVRDNPNRENGLDQLKKGQRNGVPRKLILEGPTYADCAICCENALLWVEGKRNDWLATGTKWDVARDQLARNLEAAWLLAKETGNDFCVLLCYERELKHHEQLLIDGYRNGTWSGGWPHLSSAERAELGKRIGTVTWAKIVARFPGLNAVPELRDVSPDLH